MLCIYICLTWWRHQIETFSALLAFMRGIHRSSVNSPHKGQWHGALMFSLICAWINSWVNNREAGDLRRLRTRDGVIVMSSLNTSCAAYARNTDLRGQVVSSHVIDHAWYMGPCLPPGMMLAKCLTLVLDNDREWKHIHFFQNKFSTTKVTTPKSLPYFHADYHIEDWFMELGAAPLVVRTNTRHNTYAMTLAWLFF